MGIIIPYSGFIISGEPINQPDGLIIIARSVQHTPSEGCASATATGETGFLGFGFSTAPLGVVRSLPLPRPRAGVLPFLMGFPAGI